MSESAVPARASAAPVAADAPFDLEADIVVVGGGGGGLPAALFARWLGDEVVLLEKAPELGGTARKAAFWYWVPNNAPMRELGIADARSGLPALRRAPVAPASLRPRQPHARPERVGVRAVPRDLRERLAGRRAAARARRAAVPALSRRARLLVGAAGGQGADGPRPGPRRTPARRCATAARWASAR